MLKVNRCLVKYDGIQEGYGSVPDTLQWTVHKGPIEGATLNTRTIGELTSTLMRRIALFGEAGGRKP